jgi:hypothetical protein
LRFPVCLFDFLVRNLEDDSLRGGLTGVDGAVSYLTIGGSPGSWEAPLK